MLNENLVTSSEVKKHLNVDTKMFDYLTNREKVLPKGFRYSEGKGVFLCYPESIIGYCDKVKKLKREGFTFPQIKVKLEKEREELSARCDYLRNQYELDKTIRRQLAHADLLIRERNEFAHGGPDVIIKDEKGNPVFVIEAKIQEVEQELKTYFKEWDGSMPVLSRIRGKIDELEALEARERVIKSISQLV